MFEIYVRIVYTGRVSHAKLRQRFSVQLDHECGTICRRTSDLSYSCVGQSLKTFAVGQWNQRAVWIPL